MQCGAKTRSGKSCKSKPVHGSKRCRMHGGTQPVGAESPNFRTGRYSRYLKDSLQAKLSDNQDDNPLDLLPELEVQRALLGEYLERFKVAPSMTAFDIDYLMGWSAEIGKSVERIVKLRNDTALTNAEVQFLAARVVELIGKYIPDAGQQSAFVAELFATVPALDVGAIG